MILNQSFQINETYNNHTAQDFDDYTEWRK